jgi:hypothetical protein
MNNMSDIPRRICLEKLTPAEKAIRDAMIAVEEAGGDVRLTDAITLLARAKDRVSDFVDGTASPALPGLPERPTAAAGSPAPAQETKE